MQFTLAKKIIEFYLCIQMLPAKVSWLHFSWPTSTHVCTDTSTLHQFMHNTEQCSFSFNTNHSKDKS